MARRNFSSISVASAISARVRCFGSRALLRLVLFKFDIENSYALKPNANCEVDTDALRLWFRGVSYSLIEMAQDIALGSKDAALKEKCAHFQKQVSDVYAQMEGGITSMNPIPKVLKIPKLLKKIYPQCG